jgi:hypothetical protein
VAAARPTAFVSGPEVDQCGGGQTQRLFPWLPQVRRLHRSARPRQSASTRRRSAQLVFLDVFHVSGQLTDRQGDLVELLLDGTSSESAIDVDFYLLA